MGGRRRGVGPLRAALHLNLNTGVGFRKKGVEAHAPGVGVSLGLNGFSLGLNGVSLGLNGFSLRHTGVHRGDRAAIVAG